MESETDIIRGPEPLIAVTGVEVLPDYHLRLLFDTGERRVFDVRPYLDWGVFKRLKDETLFRQAHVFLGTVAWPTELDLAPETLYLDSVPERDPQCA